MGNELGWFDFSFLETRGELGWVRLEHWDPWQVFTVEFLQRPELWLIGKTQYQVLELIGNYFDVVVFNRIPVFPM